MTSQILMKRVQRCYPEAVEVSIKEVFIPEQGWVNASAGTPDFIRDNLEYLRDKGAKMVQLVVTEDDGFERYPDYDVENLLKSFKEGAEFAQECEEKVDALIGGPANESE